MRNWAELEQRCFLQVGHRRLGVTIVRGQGTRVWDDAGREYLDFAAGWGAASLGHCHPAVVEALRAQAGLLLVASDDVYTVPQLQLAELLLAHSPFDRAFFQNSGTEAVEVSIKLARKYGKVRRGGAHQVIYAERAFHGRTLGALAANGTPRYRDPFEPLPPGFVQVPFNDAEAIRRATTEQTCAVLLEPIQGEGGVHLAEPAYLRAVRDWCTQQGVLLILDEVQTGTGRTGKLFAFEHAGVVPDIVVLGKGLGGGVPISAILVREHAAVFEPGEHGTTFGGNPLVCAAALATVEWILEHQVLDHVAQVGRYFMDRLAKLQEACPLIEEVRGQGLLIAVQFSQDLAMDLVRRCVANGLLVNPLRPNTLRFMPPLITTQDEVDQALGILGSALHYALVRGGPTGAC